MLTFSIIIPVYNRSKLIYKALNSVANQLYTNWECIIVDDGSTDSTLEIVERYASKDSRFVIYKRDRPPKGASTCRNIGLENAKGKYIIFLDSDDYLLEHCLLIRLREFEKHPELDFIVFQMLVYKEATGNKVLWNISTEDSDLERFLNFDFVWSITSPIWKHKTLLKLRGFDEELSCWQDVDLSLRALLKGLKYKKKLGLPPDCVNLIHDFESISQKGSHTEHQIVSKQKVVNKVFDQLRLNNLEKMLRVPVLHIGLEYYRALKLKTGSRYLKKYVRKKVIGNYEFYHLFVIGILMKARLYYRVKKLFKKNTAFSDFFCEESIYSSKFRKIEFTNGE